MQKQKHMRKRIIALVLTLTMLFSVAVNAIAELTEETSASAASVPTVSEPAEESPALDTLLAENQFSVTAEDGSVTSVMVPRNGYMTLTADTAAASYQWQILVDNALWVNIMGKTAATLDLRYAMVANQMTDGTAYVRCVADHAASAVVSVTLDPAAPVFDTPKTEPIIIVEKEATVKETNQTPAVDLDALMAEYEAVNAAAMNAEDAYNAAYDARENAQTAYETAVRAEADAKAAYEEALAAEAPTEDIPTEETPVEDVPTEDTPVEDVPTEDAPVEDVPVEDAPVEDIPTEDTPVEDIPAEDVPAEDVSAQLPSAADTLGAAYNSAVSDTAAAAAALEAADAALTAAETAYNNALDALDATEAKVKAAQNDMGVGLLAGEEEGEDGKVETTTCTVTVRYNIHTCDIHHGEEIRDPYSETVIPGRDVYAVLESPEVAGFAPMIWDAEKEEWVSAETVTLDFPNIQEDHTIQIVYYPAETEYTVHHYQQNIADDHYTLFETEIRTGTTEATVDPNLVKTYTGFQNLLYDTQLTIAADGSTVVDIYYDRLYYKILFNVGEGAYGVEPIYARYGTPIPVPESGTWEPTRPGYEFAGWALRPNALVGNENVPSVMPAYDTTYYAIWRVVEKTEVTVIFWGENADDEEYSFQHEGKVTVYTQDDDFNPTVFTFNDQDQFLTCGEIAHQHVDACRTCFQDEHVHTSACGFNCGHEHTIECYSLPKNLSQYTLKASTPSNPNYYRDNGDGVYTYTSSGFLGIGAETYYYVKIGDQWYTAHNASGRVVNTTQISLTCQHLSHDNSCYNCGKDAHTHSYENGCYVDKSHTHDSECYENGSGMDNSLWKLVQSETKTVEPDGTTVVNVYYDRVEYSVEFYNRNGDSEYTEHRITAKWGASIYDKWPTHNGSSSWYTSTSGTEWQVGIQIMPIGGDKFYGPKTGSGTGYTANYYVEIIPGEQATEETGAFIESNGLTYKLHHSDTSVTSGSVTESEFYEIKGFIYSHGTDGNGTSMSQPGSYGSYGGSKFYYNRDEYKIEYMSFTSLVTTKTLKYEEPLKLYEIQEGHEDLKYPSHLEPGAYKFAGWYTDEYFRTPVDWENAKMPAENILLYAKWEPVKHTVKFYINKAAAENDAAAPDLMEQEEVSHNSLVTPLEKQPTYGKYTFEGWFYWYNGEEHAFDIENSIVTHDIDLYAKWSSDVPVKYRIKYAVVNDDGTYTYIAEDDTGSGIGGYSRTFDAKTDDELFEGFREGYYPEISSHNLEYLLEKVDENGEITYTFLYIAQESVAYTVRYLTEEVPDDTSLGTVDITIGETTTTYYRLKEDFTETTSKHSIAPSYEYIQGYRPDAFQKPLVLSANAAENVVDFFYTKDNEHAPLRIVHYLQDTLGNYTEIIREVNDIEATIGDECKEYLLSIPGFEYSKTSNKYTPAEDETGSYIHDTIPETGLEINLYYDRIKYPYVFRFLDIDTRKPLREEVAGEAIYGGRVSYNAVNDVFPGYHLNGDSNVALSIKIVEDGETNYYDFLYTENRATLYYKVVAPNNDAGTVTIPSEQHKVITGEALGSTAVPSSNVYKFVGWYGDEACTGEPLSIEAKFVPQKEENTLWVDGTTYYAKFEDNTTTLTIRKDGTAYDSTDTFIFDIKRDGTLVTTVTTTMDGSVTVGGLIVGVEYTVSERTANTRYTQQTDQRCKLTDTDANNEVTFTNTVKETKWLSVSETVKNIFKKTEANN